MSLPDYLLEDDRGECPECGGQSEREGKLCPSCRADIVDVNADYAYERMLERWEE